MGVHCPLAAFASPVFARPPFVGQSPLFVSRQAQAWSSRRVDGRFIGARGTKEEGWRVTVFTARVRSVAAHQVRKAVDMARAVGATHRGAFQLPGMVSSVAPRLPPPPLSEVASSAALLPGSPARTPDAGRAPGHHRWPEIRDRHERRPRRRQKGRRSFPEGDSLLRPSLPPCPWLAAPKLWSGEYHHSATDAARTSTASASTT